MNIDFVGTIEFLLNESMNIDFVGTIEFLLNVLVA